MPLLEKTHILNKMFRNAANLRDDFPPTIKMLLNCYPDENNEYTEEIFQLILEEVRNIPQTDRFYTQFCAGWLQMVAPSITNSIAVSRVPVEESKIEIPVAVPVLGESPLVVAAPVDETPVASFPQVFFNHTPNPANTSRLINSLSRIDNRSHSEPPASSLGNSASLTSQDITTNDQAHLAQQLTTFVIQGNQSAAEQILRSHPELSTMPVNIVTDYSGRSFYNVTALQLALWAEDTDMLFMLIDSLPRNELGQGIQAELLRQVNDLEQGSGVTYEFKGQTITEKSYDWSIITAIEEYKGYFSRGIYTREAISNPHAWGESLWITLVGAKQREVPANVAQYYCDQNQIFFPKFPARDAEFTSLTRTFKFTKVEQGWQDTTASWYPLSDNRGIGACFAVAKCPLNCPRLMREKTQRPKGLDEGASHYAGGGAFDDLIALKKLRTYKQDALDNFKIALLDTDLLTKPAVQARIG